MARISRRDPGGEDVTNPDYMKTISMGEGNETVRDQGKPLKDKTGRGVPPLGRETRGKWYDADLN